MGERSMKGKDFVLINIIWYIINNQIKIYEALTKQQPQDVVVKDSKLS